MNSLFDRKAWAERMRRLEIARIVVVVVTPLVWLLFVAIRRRRAFYQGIFHNCLAACFVECWSAIAKGKLIDIRSPLATEINNALDYYLTQAVYAREQFGSFEQMLLNWQYALWVLRDTKRPDEHRARNFAAEHDLAPILEKYANFYNYVCFMASKEIEKLEIQQSEPVSSNYWRSKVRFSTLPHPLGDKTKARVVRSYFASLARELKRNFARANYLKIDFTLSDLTSFVALCGALLLVMGVRIFVLGGYFGFPFQNYFGVADYLASSLNLTGQVLLGGLLAGVSGYTTIATSNSYSVQQTELETYSRSARAARIGFHLGGIGAIIAAPLAYFRLGVFDTISALGALVYVGIFILGRASVAFFENPVKAYVAMSMVYFSFAATLTGAFGEINRLNQPSGGSPTRVLQFEGARYDEKEWQIIAFTTDYVILRNRQTTQLIVRARKELKAVETETPHP
ncbi:hypothetical protein [Bradyrhizobium japonicum]|uniref:hypothetical protein n=1 Tax=Bradyrhizobium japonicum TaxID=375 RepID=UPI003B67CFF0